MLFLLYAAITLNWLIFFLNPWSWSRRVLWISLSVLLSESYFGIGSFYSFFGNQHGLREPCGVVYHRAGFFENKIFAPENGDNRPSLRFFKCIGKPTYYFFSMRSIMKVCTTCCMVTQFGIILFPEIWTKILLTN